MARRLPTVKGLAPPDAIVHAVPFLARSAQQDAGRTAVARTAACRAILDGSRALARANALCAQRESTRFQTVQTHEIRILTVQRPDWYQVGRKLVAT